MVLFSFTMDIDLDCYGLHHIWTMQVIANSRHEKTTSSCSIHELCILFSPANKYINCWSYSLIIYFQVLACNLRTGDSKKMELMLFTQITSSVLGNTKQSSKLTELIVICLKAMDHTGKEMEDAAEVTWGSPSLNTLHSSAKSLSMRRAPTCNFVNMKSQDIEGEGANSTINVSVAAGSKALPFEFKALEACLESACRCLETEVHGYLLLVSISISSSDLLSK